MQLHELKRRYRHQRKKIVGRGGKRGTTAGRGTKGQKARAGHRIRPEIRDVIKKFPKKRGSSIHGVFRSQTAAARVVSLAVLSRYFAPGAVVSPETLLDQGLIRPSRAFNRRRGSLVKILGGGKMVIKLTIKNCLLSRSARAAIEAAGGAVE